MNLLGRRMLESAWASGVCLGGFDAFNMESARAIVRAADELGIPVFLQVCIMSAEHMGMEMASRILLEAKRKCAVDACVHLDHGPGTSDFEQLKDAVELGFESVMVDGSSMPINDNIALTKRVIEIAHPRGVSVEGELGRVSRDIHARREEIERLMTDPDEAARFCDETHVDYLAVSVGSISGQLQRKSSLDLERFQKIRDKVEVPLVFHGGTGISESQLKEAVRIGVSKINIAHGFRKSFLDGIADYLRSHPDEIDPRKVMGAAADSCERFVREKMRQMYTAGTSGQ